jgi:hypothetical protein
MPWNLALSSSPSCCGASLLQLRQSATSFKLSAAPCVSGGLVLWLCEPPVRYLRGNRQIGYTAPHVSELKPALSAGKLRPNAVTEAKQYLASVASSFFSSHIGAPESHVRLLDVELRIWCDCPRSQNFALHYLCDS